MMGSSTQRAKDMTEGNHFHFYFDYFSSPFWPADSATWDKWREPLGHQRHEILPLTAETVRSCEELSLWYDSVLNWSDPGNGLLWDRAENERFLVAARELFQRAQAELGEDFELIDRLDLNDIIEEGYSPPEITIQPPVPAQSLPQPLLIAQLSIWAKIRGKLRQWLYQELLRLGFETKAIVTFGRANSRDEPGNDPAGKADLYRHHLPLTRYSPGETSTRGNTITKKGRQ
jgi:hypothetical protein